MSSDEIRRTTFPIRYAKNGSAKRERRTINFQVIFNTLDDILMKCQAPHVKIQTIWD